MDDAVQAPIARVLTIAGSDSGGGAGIEADLKTFTALGVYGMAALTSVTAQNTVGVAGIHDLPPAFVAEQIDAVAKDIGVDAAKTGMLSNVGIVEAVAAAIGRNGISKLVVDPVMVSKSGAPLLQDDARNALKTLLLPIATVVTPNIPETEALVGKPVESVADIQRAAERIHEFGPRYVLVKGGHLRAGQAMDYLFDGEHFQVFSAPWIDTKNTHGTGCTYSAAIAVYLARGLEIRTAVRRAKRYVTEAIRQGLPLGSGYGPINHLWPVLRGTE